MDKKSISLIVPCFQEEKTIYKNIAAISAYLRNNFLHYEIIAVNDGSRDGTEAELKRAQRDFSARVISNKINRGKGKAVKDGILASHHDTVMFMDADMAIPVESIAGFVAEIENGQDIVIASRFVPGLKILEPVLWYRKFMERIFRLLRMIILNSYVVKDTQCGFKMFTRSSAMDIFQRATIERFAFDAEIIYIAAKKGYRIKELPVTLQNPARSSIRLFGDSWNMFCDLIKIKKNDWMGKYK